MAVPSRSATRGRAEILVCRTTNPSWTPLFGLADAIVLDIGGPNRHGPIIARERGIPCVINVGNGTSALHNGDHVRVDGTAGLVTVLQRAHRQEAGAQAPTVTSELGAQ